MKNQLRKATVLVAMVAVLVAGTTGCISAVQGGLAGGLSGGLMNALVGQPIAGEYALTRAYYEHLFRLRERGIPQRQVQWNLKPGDSLPAEAYAPAPTSNSAPCGGVVQGPGGFVWGCQR